MGIQDGDEDDNVCRCSWDRCNIDSTSIRIDAAYAIDDNDDDGKVDEIHISFLDEIS